jgi:hypothetical protein
MDRTDPRDPGPPPPRGIVVRPDGEGFYARVYPRPPLGLARFVAVTAGLAVVGLLVALLAATDPILRAWIVVSTVLFGLLIAGVSFGSGFVPVEVSADDETVYWGGERYPIGEVGTCRPEGARLVLRARDGRELASITHALPDVAVWLGLAVEASLPGT